MWQPNLAILRLEGGDVVLYCVHNGKVFSVTRQLAAGFKIFRFSQAIPICMFTPSERVQLPRG